MEHGEPTRHDEPTRHGERVQHDGSVEHAKKRNDEKPRVFAITGIMAAGKSTVAQALAERFTRSVHVRGDVFRRMIVSGSAPSTPIGGEAMDAELRLRYRLSAMVTEEYARAGYTVVVQDVILGADLAAYVGMIKHRPLSVVVLAPRPEVVARREATRPKKGYTDWTVEALDTSLREETPRLGLWLDTSDQTPEQTVDEILACIPESNIPGSNIAGFDIPEGGIPKGGIPEGNIVEGNPGSL